MSFWNFYYTFGFFITIVLCLATFCIQKDTVKGALVLFQLISLGLQICSIFVVVADRHAAHYQKGNCYVRYDGKRQHMAMIVDSLKEEYVYAIYLEADPRMGEPDSYFAIDSRNPDTRIFNSFENIYPTKVDCPNVQTKVF